MEIRKKMWKKHRSSEYTTRCNFHKTLKYLAIHVINASYQPIKLYVAIKYKTASHTITPLNFVK